MLAKEKGNSTVNRQRAIKRQYGESLPSDECVERKRPEEEGRAQNLAKKEKNRGKKYNISEEKESEPAQEQDPSHSQPQNVIERVSVNSRRWGVTVVLTGFQAVRTKSTEICLINFQLIRLREAI